MPHISTTKFNRLMLFRGTNDVYCESRTNSVGKMQSFCMLKQLVHIEPLGFKGLNRIKSCI
jgi:hypothetical protein